MAQLYSLEVERHSLSGFFKHPEVYPEIDAIMSEYDYYSETHRTIFAVIRSVLSKGEKLDKVIVAQKIKNLGYKPKDDIDIFSYLDALAGSQITAKGALDACKELVKFRVRREINETADQIKEFIAKNGELKIDELVSQADKIYNDKINSYQTDDEPIDVFKHLTFLVNERISNPESQTELVVPYEKFYQRYGGLRPGNLYSFVSRPGVGKSNILGDLAYKTALINNCKALILDTENLTDDICFRMAAAVSNVPFHYLEKGLFVKNAELAKRYNDSKEKLKKLESLVFHKQVAGKPIEQVVSIIKRWYFKEVGRGNPALIVYDYIKLTGEQDYNKKEYELIGEKANRLKELSVELNVPVLTANQLNRTAESGTDDSSAISQSDRLLWFSSHVSIFRRKTLEEIAEDGPEFGSHKLLVLKSRFQGKNSPGHMDLVRISTGKKTSKYVNNFISFNIDNFLITETGDLRDILTAQAEKYKLEEGNDGDNNTNL